MEVLEFFPFIDHHKANMIGIVARHTSQHNKMIGRKSPDVTLHKVRQRKAQKTDGKARDFAFVPEVKDLCITPAEWLITPHNVVGFDSWVLFAKYVPLPKACRQFLIYNRKKRFTPFHVLTVDWGALAHVDYGTDSAERAWKLLGSEAQAIFGTYDDRMQCKLTVAASLKKGR